MADIEFRQSRESIGGEKEEGTDYDYKVIVDGLRAGLSYESACDRLPIRILPSFLDKIRPTMEKWAKEGRPKERDTISGKSKKPVEHIVKDGKIFAIYADGTAMEVKVVGTEAPKK